MPAHADVEENETSDELAKRGARGFDSRLPPEVVVADDVKQQAANPRAAKPQAKPHEAKPQEAKLQEAKPQEAKQQAPRGSTSSSASPGPMRKNDSKNTQQVHAEEEDVPALPPEEQRGRRRSTRSAKLGQQLAPGVDFSMQPNKKRKQKRQAETKTELLPLVCPHNVLYDYTDINVATDMWKDGLGCVKCYEQAMAEIKHPDMEDDGEHEEIDPYEQGFKKA